MNAFDHFRTGFRETPESRFLEDEAGHTLTYADLERETARVAAFLTMLGLERGARVAAQIEKSKEGIVLYLGALRAGFCFVPLNPAYQTSELEYLLHDAKPEVLVCRPDDGIGSERPDLLRQIRHVFTLGPGREGTLVAELEGATSEFAPVPRAPDEPAVIVYTSGTTGRAKGAIVTHGNLTSNADVLRRHWQITKTDVLIHALPLFHVHGLFVALHPILCAGASLLFHQKFDPKQVLRALPRATLLMGVPTFYTRLLAEADLSREVCRNMRLFVSGSAPLLSETHRSFSERTGHEILERYGMSEAGMITSNPYSGDRRPGTVGQPLPGVSLRVVDDHGQDLPPGEPGGIEIKGPNVFAGYFGLPERTLEDFTPDGYFRTGDIGVLSADGYVAIVGRGKDMIITGGLNVYPKEIELVLDAFPEVEESAVVGVPDEDFGEAVTAVIVLRRGEALTETEVITRMKSAIAHYKVPKRVHFRAELPRNGMGKVQKAVLRKELGVHSAQGPSD